MHRRGRGRGLGALVTSALSRTAFDRGADLVVLTTDHEGACKAYEKAGFTRLSRYSDITREFS